MSLDEIDIISFQELLDRIDYQFNPELRVEEDRSDYIKWYMLKVLEVEEKDFPGNVYEKLTDENRGEFESLIDRLIFHMKQTFGIRFDDTSTRLFENIYNLYYFFIVDAKQFIIDYLCYFHFYQEGYDIGQYYKNYCEKNNVELPDIFTINPVKHFNTLYEEMYGDKKQEEVEYGPILYQERMKAFMLFVEATMQDPNHFNMYEVFEKLNIMNPCNEYEELDFQINTFNGISFEDDTLIVDQLMERNFNNKEEAYINKEIIDVFFKYLANYDGMINRAMK